MMMVSHVTAAAFCAAAVAIGPSGEDSCGEGQYTTAPTYPSLLTTLTTIPR